MDKNTYSIEGMLSSCKVVSLLDNLVRSLENHTKKLICGGIYMNREEKIQFAGERFSEGLNCAQSTFLALAGGRIDEKTALRVASCFGGGMRCGEVCGAVTGSLMAIGLHRGYHSAADKDGKMYVNQQAVLFEERFKEENGSILCKELLKYDLSKPEDLEKIKELHLFDTVCPRMVTEATRIADEILAGD